MALTKISTAMISQDAASVDLNIDAGTLYIDSTNNRIGVGNTSPTADLHIKTSSSDTGVDLILDGNRSSNGGIGSIIFSNSGDTVGMIRSNRASANDAAHMLFYTQAASGSNTERMRIDSSGNLLIKKTSVNNSTVGVELKTDGSANPTVDGDTVARFNRLTSDGEIIRFQKDTTTVGNIFTDNSGDLGIGNDDTGLLFVGGSDLIAPWNPTGPASRDAVISLGNASNRFNNLYMAGTLYGPATFTIDPATHGDNTGTVVIAGNLQVDGTTTTINSTTLTVDDKLITLASGSANAAAANGAGIEVEISGATNPSLTYDGTNDEWDFNKDVNVTGTIDASGALTLNSGTNGLPTINLSHSNSSADNFRIQGGIPGISNGGFSIRDVDAGVNRLSINSDGNSTFSGDVTVQGLGVGSYNSSYDFYNNGTSYLNGAVTVDSTATFTDGSEARFGDGNDMALFHSAGVNHLRVNSGAFKIRADDLRFTAQNGTTEFMTVASGAVTVKSGSTLTLNRTDNAIGGAISYVQGTGFLLNDANGDGFSYNVGASNKVRFTPSGSITFGDSHTIGNDADDNLEIASSSSENIIINSADDIILDADGGDIKLKDGSTHWASLYTNGTNTYLQSMVNSGDVYLSGKDGSGNGVNALRLDMDNSGRAYFNAGASFNGNINANDNEQLILGTNDDFRIFHNGSGVNYLQSYTSGELRLESNGNTTIRTNNGEDMAVFVKNGAVELYYDNSKRFQTAASGVVLTSPAGSGQAVDLDFLSTNTSGFGSSYSIDSRIRSVTAGSSNAYHSQLQFYTNDTSNNLDLAMTIDPSQNVGIGTSSPGSFHANASNLVVGSGSGTEGITINSGTSNYGVIYFADGTSGSAAYAGNINYNHSDNSMRFGTAGSTTSVVIDSSGNVGIGTTAPEAPLEIYKTVDGDSVGLLVMNQKSYGSGTGTNERSTIALGIAEAGASSTGRKFGTIHVRPYAESDSANGIFSFGVRGAGAIRDDALVLRGYGETDLRVGIGDAAPGWRFTVEGSSADDWISRIYNTATDGAGLLVRTDATYANDKIALGVYADSGYKMVVRSTGNVGIGRTDPSYGLDVKATGNSLARFVSSSSDALVRIIANNYATEADARLFLGEADSYGMTFEYDGIANIGYIGMNDGVDPTTGSYSKRIQFPRGSTDTSFMAGKVGIGTTSPGDYHSATPLVINNGGNASGITIVSGTSASGNIFFADGTSGNAAYRGFVQYQHSGDKLVFGTAGDDRLFIDSTGNMLMVNGSPEFHFGTTSASHYNWRIAAQEVVDTGFEIASGTQSLGTNAASDTYTTRFIITGTGNVGIGTTGVNLDSTDIALQVGSSSYDNPAIQIRSSSTGTGRLWFGDNSGTDDGRADGYIQYEQGNRAMKFGTAQALRMSIDQYGQFAVRFNDTINALVIGGPNTVNGVTATPSNSGTVMALGRDTGSNRSAHFAGHLKFDNGYGIDFGSTSNAGGMSSSVLDDYEEGTWTPTLAAQGTNPAPTSVNVTNATYVKVGKRVFFSCYINQNLTSAGSGAAYINGLPFTVEGSSYHPVLFTHGNMILSHGGYVGSGTTRITAIAEHSTAGIGFAGTGNRYLMVSGQYDTAS